MPTSPLRVLFLMEDLCYGGTQRQTLELARRLDRQKFTPVMLTLTGPTDLDAAAKDAGIELHHLGKGRHVPPTFFLQLAVHLNRLVPDIIMPCTALPNIWGRILPRVQRFVKRGSKSPRIVGTCRGGGAPTRQHERFFWRLTDHMICNSEALQKILLNFGVPHQRLSYIPNGVDTDFFAPSEPAPSLREPLILCVARLAGDKDHMTLLRAFDLVLKRHPSARLRLVGDGPEEAALKRWAEENPSGSRVDFVPGGLDMRMHYATARVFALSSAREGQPNVILEAMACGLPVCATSVGGIPRLVEPEGNGLLSPASDADALARHCCRLLEDNALCDSMGIAGRQRVVRDFSFTAMVNAHEDVFSRLK